MSSKKIQIAIILGSTREGRVGEVFARWMYEEAKKRGEFEVELLDLRDYPLPFFDEAVSPSRRVGPPLHPVAKKWAERIGQADAFVIVTPEYNHGYPGVLKNALDWVYGEWGRKPVGFVSYGGVGGARSVEQLRQVVIDLHMAPIGNAIHISSFRTLLDESGKLKTDSLNSLAERAEKFLNELYWWGSALKNAREASH